MAGDVPAGEGAGVHAGSADHRFHRSQPAPDKERTAAIRVAQPSRARESAAVVADLPCHWAGDGRTLRVARLAGLLQCADLGGCALFALVVRRGNPGNAPGATVDG